MTDEYSTAFRNKLKREPIRHLLRLADYSLRRAITATRLHRARSRFSSATTGLTPVSSRLQPPPHRYIDYRGPWIEDRFFRHWVNSEHRPDVTYVPVFWTDFFLWAQTHRYLPREFQRINRELRTLLDTFRDSGRPGFTVLEYDHAIWDWHLFPDNVAVFSAGGYGDIPIPLLKGSPPYSAGRPRDIRVSFYGTLTGPSDAHGLRSRLFEALKHTALFGQGPEWRSVMSRSVFSLCPRGLGRASFRLYEALSMGSIPVYVWDDLEWLPYQDELDWSEFALSVRVSELPELPRRLESISAQQIARMQERIRELYEDYFTLDGTCRQIERRLPALSHVEAVRELTRQRHRLNGVGIAS